MNRRFFIKGLIATPAVVAASSLMPVRSIARIINPIFLTIDGRAGGYYFATMKEAWQFAANPAICPPGASAVFTLSSGIYRDFCLILPNRSVTLRPANGAVVDVSDAWICSRNENSPLIDAVGTGSISVHHSSFSHDTPQPPPIIEAGVRSGATMKCVYEWPSPFGQSQDWPYSKSSKS
jgi:hypothetical protein